MLIACYAWELSKSEPKFSEYRILHGEPSKSKSKLLHVKVRVDSSNHLKERNSIFSFSEKWDLGLKNNGKRTLD